MVRFVGGMFFYWYRYGDYLNLLWLNVDGILFKWCMVYNFLMFVLIGVWIIWWSRIMII